MDLNLPKNGLNKNQHPQDTICANLKVWIPYQRLQYTMCANFQLKWTALSFSA